MVVYVPLTVSITAINFEILAIHEKNMREKKFYPNKIDPIKVELISS